MMSFLRFARRVQPVITRQFSISYTRFKDIADHHEILGVTKKSTKEEIKEAFFEKSKQLHPDTDTGDIEKFKELNTAYEQCLNYAKAPHEMTLKELQDRAKEEAESKQNAHSPFIVENAIEYSIIFSVCFAISYLVADGLYRFHPLSDGLSSLDQSTNEKLIACKKQIAILEQEQYEWQAKHKQTKAGPASV
uniref:DnaJ homolog subfamily C member 4-like n=1 Tax=Crassostrea virginica TaxID=6565 RepID=A0A8B8E1U5_CRAVI|nr:dnaJ homolog subfamily C member 4-like [Crassostrea virginica]